MMWLLSLLGGLRFLVGHIRTHTAFPKPLTAGEEAAALARLAAGDRRARDVLVEHNMRLVAHIAKKYRACGCEQDDLISVGSIGLIKAVETFQPEKGRRLSAYAARCIENEIRMVLRSSKKIKQEVSLQDPVGCDREGNEVTLIDILKSDEPELTEDVETRFRVRAMLRKMDETLEEKEKRVLILRYGLGGREPLPQREVAKRMGISRSYVSRIEKAAMEKMKKTHL